MLSRRNLLKLGRRCGRYAWAHWVSGRGESFADGDPPPGRKPGSQISGGTFRIRIAQSRVHFDPHQTAAYSTMVRSRSRIADW